MTIWRLKPWLECKLDGCWGFLYPPVCQICFDSRATAPEGFVCSACVSQPAAVRWIRDGFCARCGLPYEGEMPAPFACENCHGLDLGFEFARAAVVASPFILGLVHRYKYHDGRWLEPRLLSWLVEMAAPQLRATDWDWLMPVPLHPTRQRERGFNQAEQLACGLAAVTGIPVNTRVLSRVRYTDTQTALNRRNRQVNMAKAFAAERVEHLQGCRVILVDDVLTTGATTGACARQLMAAGASRVGVWTLARGS